MIEIFALGAFMWMAGARPVSPVPLCTLDDRSAIRVYGVAVDPTDADRFVVAAARDTVYRSTGRDDCVIRSDAGLVAPSALFGRPVNPYRFAIDSENPDRIYVGTTIGLHASADGGHSWEVVLLPTIVIGEAPIYNLAIDPARHNIVYAGGIAEIYKTVDGGDNWTSLNNGFPAPPAVAPGTAGFAIDPRHTDIVYVASYGVYKTTNGGELWMQMNQGLPAENIHAIAVDWANPDVVYAGLDGGLFRSGDAAESWQPTTLSGHVVLDVQQDRANGAVLFAGTDSGAFRSGDGGESWSPLTSPFSEATVHEIAIAPSDPATIYAATEIGIFRSRDGGTTWAALGIDHRVTRVIWSRDLSP